MKKVIVEQLTKFQLTLGKRKPMEISRAAAWDLHDQLRELLGLNAPKPGILNALLDCRFIDAIKQARDIYTPDRLGLRAAKETLEAIRLFDEGRLSAEELVQLSRTCGQIMADRTFAANNPDEAGGMPDPEYKPVKISFPKY